MGKKSDIEKTTQTDERFRWNLKDLYPCDEAWEKSFAEVKEKIETLTAYKGRLGESAESFFGFLENMHETEYTLEKLSLYANLAHSEDTRVTKYIEYSAKGDWLQGQFEEKIAFFLPEYKALSPEQVKGFLTQMPDRAYYGRFIEELERLRPHILAEEEETLLAQSGEALEAIRNTYDLFVNADLSFPEVQGEKGKIKLTEANYGALIRSRNRKVRKEAFLALFDTYGKFKNTLSQTLNGSAKGDFFYARAKRFPDTITASLFGDNVTPDFYDLVLEKIHQGLPENHRYIAFKKKCLDLDPFYPYDLYTPLIQEQDQESLSYEEAKEIVVEGLKSLGEEYGRILREGLEGRWVDVYPQDGKVSGAFCAHVWDVHPYVLLNFNGTFHEALTLGHEMGHAMHSYFSNQSQPFIYSDYSIMAAEVASITNELLILRSLLEKTKESKKRLNLMNTFLENFRTTVFRQAMFAEFERKTHGRIAEGDSLTAEWLCGVWKGLNEKYYGPALAYEPALDMEWARIPHFYSSFYVYKYVLGFVSAVVISEAIHKGEPGAVGKYIQFLRSGSTADPLVLLERLGVRLKSGEAITSAIDTFRTYLDNFMKEF